MILMNRAVIFDWDGTLADTKNAILQSFQKVLRRNDCHVSDETIERWVGIGTKKTFEKVLEECGIRFDHLMVEKLATDKINHQLGLTNIVTLFDGAVELLGGLQGRIKIALATMSNRIIVDRLLSEKKIKNYFNVVFSADDIDNPKPDPEVFLVSANSLGVKPQDCVVIEDSVFGIRAAKEAHMKCIAVSSGAYNLEELLNERPDIVVSSLAEKEKILNYIFSGKQGKNGVN